MVNSIFLPINPQCAVIIKKESVELISFIYVKVVEYPK